MTGTWVKQGLRFLFLFAFQVLILKQVHLNVGSFNYISLMIIPLWIMLLPVNTPKWLMVSLGFLMGFLVDWFYDSPGVHASAGTFIGFARPFILEYFEPKGGYNRVPIPSKFHLGVNWFITYASITLMAYLLFYFSMEVFTPAYLGTILLKTIFSFILSILLVLLYMFIFDPE
jgi:rod shape-determining protein MreD